MEFRDAPVVQQAVPVVEQVPVEHVPVQHAVVTPAPTHVDRVDRYGSIAPYAIAAGLLVVATLVWGGVAMARGRFDEPMRDPIVSVGGLSGNAISGLIVTAVGLGLLLGSRQP